MPINGPKLQREAQHAALKLNHDDFMAQMVGLDPLLPDINKKCQTFMEKVQQWTKMHVPIERQRCYQPSSKDTNQKIFSTVMKQAYSFIQYHNIVLQELVKGLMESKH